jgi:hypothetical protein
VHLLVIYKHRTKNARYEKKKKLAASISCFAGMPRTVMRLDAKNLVKGIAFGHRCGATRTWGTSDDGVGIAVSSASASVCRESADYRGASVKHTNGNCTISATSPTALEGQR